MNELTNNLLKSINDFSQGFKKEPYSYLLESDIQSSLFAKLRIDINQYVDVVGINEEKYHLNLINTEYLDRFDICCLNPEKVSTITESDIKQNQGHDDYIYQLPVHMAIELKYIWGIQRRGFDIFTSDAAKIQNSKFKNKIDNWLSICFIQTKNALDWQLQYADEGYNISEITNIKNLNSAYIISSTASYEITKI